MNRNLSLCGVVVASLLLPACATITRGTSQKYNIETSPTEAEVKLSTGQTCVSPCKLNLKRKHGFTVTANKAGHQQAVVTVESKVKAGGAAGVAGNVIFGGVIGAAVDVTNGSMNDLTPNPLVVVLKPLVAVPTATTIEPTASAPVAAATSVEAVVPTSENTPAPAPAGDSTAGSTN